MVERQSTLACNVIVPIVQAVLREFDLFLRACLPKVIRLRHEPRRYLAAVSLRDVVQHEADF